MESKECMKCGREICAEQVFCDECLAEMDKYPVKPGVVVMLPRRRAQAAKEKPARRRQNQVPPEEQIKLLKKRLRIQRIALALLGLLLAASMWLQISYQLEKKENKLLPGQNYSAETTAAGGNR